MGRVRQMLGRPVVIGALAVAVLAAAFGAYWFQPWKLWQDETVREELPVAASTPTPAPTGTPPKDAPAGDTASEPPAPPAEPKTLVGGELVTHEHKTTGTARVLELPDGSRTLRLEGLDTSNGPDLRVWITDAPVIEGKAGWGVFDDGKYQDLGKLKGNKGDQNYALPADLDLGEYTSVSIWCDRFDVSFGAAELAAA
ncbi:DM13 domain-containing protein [Streptomyces sp. E11-3]|uniref:DM13 domain-containing protein n=1 Tax=Streptomyces sp. E11-3 TaxID=3110112 RepID=UPI00397FD169